jgi:hypothetical protein
MLLTVPDVRERYRISTRAARNVMHEAGSFIVGGKLMARLEDLEAWELQRIARKPHISDASPRKAVSPMPSEQLKPTDLKEGWWRD